jgi:hypothetical protein
MDKRVVKSKDKDGFHKIDFRSSDRTTNFLHAHAFLATILSPISTIKSDIEISKLPEYYI